MTNAAKMVQQFPLLQVSSAEKMATFEETVHQDWPFPLASLSNLTSAIHQHKLKPKIHLNLNKVNGDNKDSNTMSVISMITAFKYSFHS